MKADPNIGQVRNGDVPHDPDGRRITGEFYACVGTIAGALLILWSIWP
jgi:hypothetical protein